MKKLLPNLSKLIFPLAILAIVILLAASNYTPNTWLSGWDTLHPEFDFKLYLQRVFYGAWQEHQGVGAAASQAHGAELTRLPILLFLSLFLKTSDIRYAFFFLTLFVGTLGAYFFLNHALKAKNSLSTRFASFVGANFYLLNLATVQQYYVPLEMFAVHFATLPWLVLTALKYLKKPNKKTLLVFGLVNLLATPMAHTATLFYVYFGVFVLFLGLWSLFSKTRRREIKKSLVLIATTLIVHSFWLMPNLYFVANHAGQVSESKIHSIFSDEAFLQGRGFGTIEDLALFKNFLFNWREFDAVQNTYVDLLDEWSAHLEAVGVSQVGYALFGLAVLGFIISVFGKNKVAISLSPLLILSVIFWINQNPPFEPIFAFLREHISLFGEALRFPFTKFSFLLTFSLSFYLAYLLSFLFKIVKPVGFLLAISTFAGIFYFSSPVFRGSLISPSMRVAIPNEYFQMFDWFKAQEDVRVAKLPLHTFWGWNFYSWGYQGAGFTWFGISQPTLDREFDRWSPNNESFYNEASFALYNGTGRDFERVLAKYNVHYLLLDESVLNAGGSAELLRIDEIKKILEDSESIRLAKQFGFLTVYETSFAKPVVWAPRQVTLLQTDLTYSQEDSLYSQFGDYADVSGGAIYPFVNTDKRTIKYGYDGSFVILTYGLPKVREVEPSLYVPDYLTENQKFPLEVLASQAEGDSVELTLKLDLPEILVGGQTVYGGPVTLKDTFNIREVYAISVGNQVFWVSQLTREEKVLGTVLVDTADDIDVRVFSESRRRSETALTNRLRQQSPRWCSNPNNILTSPQEGGVIRLDVNDESVCLGTYFVVPRTSLYEVSFESKSSTGDMLGFCITQGDDCLSWGKRVIDQGDGWYRQTYKATLEPGNYWMDIVGQSKEDHVRYFVGDFGVSSIRLLDQQKYSITDSLSLFTGEKVVSLDQDFDEISVKIPIQSLELEKFGPDRGFRKPTNCDLKKVGNVFKEVASRGVLYRATDGGVSCDFFEYKSLGQGSYFMLIKGENLYGRSLKVYLQNLETGRMDLEELLPPGSFFEVYPILESVNEEGYTLNLETRSFGRISSENRLESIEFVYAPYSWLQKVRIGDLEKVVDNNLTVRNTQKLNPSMYKATVSGSGVLVLDQGYEDGWVAIQLKSVTVGQSQSKSVFPRMLEHVRVNSWTNGFIVNSQLQSVTVGQSQQKLTAQPTDSNRFQPTSTDILIIYWPQYLEYLGLILVATFFVLFGVRNLSKSG